VLCQVNLLHIIPERYQLAVRYGLDRALRRFDSELDIIQFIVRQRHFAIDIGGNGWAYSYRLSQLFAAIHVFQPPGEHLRVIRSTNRQNITVHEMTFAPPAPHEPVWIPGAPSNEHNANLLNASEADKGVSAFSYTLDGFRFKFVDFIKVDVDGQEMEVLRRAQQTIERCRPVIFIKMRQHGLAERANELVGCLTPLRYRSSFLHGDAMLPFNYYAAHNEGRIFGGFPHHLVFQPLL
jgi:FkbM family methyltransferase